MAGVIMTSSTAQLPSTKTGDHKTDLANLQLEVVAGVHRGVVLTLDKADYRIGCSRQADIVLSDRGISPEHAVLRNEGATVRIEATGGEVSVEQKSIPMGYGRRVRLPTEIILGEARLHLSRSINAEFTASSAGLLFAATGRLLVNKPIVTGSVLICSAFVITAMALDLPQLAQMNFAQARTNDARTSQAKTNVDSTGEIAVDRSVTSTTAMRTSSSNIQSVATAAQAAQDLSKHLDAAKIQTLRVSTIDGRLAVSGTLTKPQMLEWTAIQRWFDQTYGSRIVLTANIADGDGRTKPRLQLQAIWYGDQPYIVTAEGERYYQGAVLDNGWIVREIAADHLLLARDGDTVALTY
jgi:anti-sigma28 factor (negative regulator of flagellin synthesis)